MDNTLKPTLPKEEDSKNKKKIEDLDSRPKDVFV